MAYGPLTEALDSALFKPKNSLTMLREGEKRRGLFRLVLAGSDAVPARRDAPPLAGSGSGGVDLLF